MANSPMNPQAQALVDSYQNPDYLERHELIQRYLRQELSATELACLEAAIIAKPALIEHIEQQRLLNAAHRANATALQPGAVGEHSAEYATQDSTKGGGESHTKGNAEAMGPRLVGIGARPWVSRALPLAACLVVALFVMSRSPLWDGGIRGGDQAAQPVLVLQTLRGSVAVHTVMAGAPLALRIDVGPPRADARYRLRLLEAESGQLRLQLDNLAADSEGWLQTNLAATALTGRHRLEVQSQDGTRTQSFLLDFQ